MAANVATTLAAALKVFYLDGQNDQLNRSSVLYNKLAKPAKLDVTGKSYTYLLRTSKNKASGIGFAEGAAFPAAGNQGWTNCIVPNKYIGSAIEITGPAVRAAKGNLGSFVNGVKSEVDGITSDTIQAINRQLNSDGTDALASWVATDDTSGTIVDDGAGNAFVLLDNGVTQCDLVAISDNATLHGTNIAVTKGAEAATNFAITWTGTVASSAAGDYLIPTGTLGKQLMGIRGIISATDPPLLSGGLQGLTVAANPYWSAQVFAAAGVKRDLSLPLMQSPLTKVGINSAFTEADIKFMLSNGPVKDKYIALCVADKRHVNEMELDGGQTAVSFNNKPLIVDPMCRRNTIYYINPKTIDLLTSSDGLQWADFLDGEQFRLKVGSSGYSDAYQAFLVFYGEMATKSRNGSAVLNDISE